MKGPVGVTLTHAAESAHTPELSAFDSQCLCLCHGWINLTWVAVVAFSSCVMDKADKP